MHWSADYVGIPFKWGGYGHDGASCWGLLCLVQEEVFGRRLPHQDEAVDAIRKGEELPRGIWKSGVVARPIAMSEAQGGDVLHMLSGDRRPNHVGTFTGTGHVLHIERGTASLLESIRSPRFKWRPIQAYRLD